MLWAVLAAHFLTIRPILILPDDIGSGCRGPRRWIIAAMDRAKTNNSPGFCQLSMRRLNTEKDDERKIWHLPDFMGSYLLNAAVVGQQGGGRWKIAHDISKDGEQTCISEATAHTKNKKRR